MNTPVYLDYNATAPIRPEAAEAVARALAIGGNPSSVHAAGRAARAAVEDARARVAALVAGDPANLVFLSGGTEANALAIDSAAQLADVSSLIVGATEHDAVIESARAAGKPVEVLPVDTDGVADLDRLEALLKVATGRPFVALMLANNETGVIQPVAEAARLVREAGGWLHVDAVQAAGKIEVDFEALGADTLALSAHKLGGPHGVGALLYGERAVLSRRLHGGGQERGRRAGTENVAGIVGFGAAADAAVRDLPTVGAQAAWRDAVAARLKAAGAVVAGGGASRVAGTLCVAVPDWTSELQVIALDLAGVMVSAGAACSSGKVKPSRVLNAMGLEALAAGGLRASGGWASTEADWNAFADAWLAARERQVARKRSAA
ncbi:cysteine desulfurase family protein [Caulobacter sp. 17J80-11]|uniref:cysteine desulfurase family protein n=1 Tax=Caulobacter sp. 17J80-11 TaxID=2763502 RepID=UPI0016535003|nr:cysteine desulfurase family protein [Caulobacter sp. 17J80-11]MBC6983255.1 cysteine desulfurase [Caulobacter sp. 17J80-11]